ncbi:MAG TPA: S9 family peptidase [Chloroflexia bacterium]|nr:S9 family peptidase [Chloroflexia bacterium]
MSLNKDFGPYLNVKNAIFPAYAAGGAKLLFLTDITGTNQVWSVQVNPAGSWPDQLTFYDERVTGIYPDPTNDAFIITRDRGGDEQDQFYLLQGDVAQGITITTLVDTPEYKNNFGCWRPDGMAYSFSSNRRHTAFLDLYIHELGQEPRMVYQADATLNPEAFSPDGRYLVFRRSNTNLDTDLFLLDLANPDQPPRHLTPHQEQALFEECAFSPDGTAIYCITNLNRDFAAPARLDLADGKLTYLAERNWDSSVLRLSPDGKKLLYDVNENGMFRLFIYELQSGTETEVPGLPPGTVLGLGLVTSHPIWSPDSRRIAFSFNSPVHNADIWQYELGSEKSYPVTFSPKGGLNPQRFVVPELVKFPTFDGLQIPALLFLPEGAETKATTPFIVLVHGGPESQTTFNWNPVLQYYVSQGYGVLAPNVRGSSGYGKKYLALDDVRKRGDSVADLKAAVEYLRAGGIADPKRIAVYGQSYGGFMVLAAITTYPELWAAGVDIYGIANMLTFLENTSPYRRKLRTPEYGDPDVDRDFLIEISPIHKIDRITAPLMVIHGARDPRVPIGESDQMVESLLARQHPVEYHVFDDEGHGITKLKNKLAVYPAVAAFLDRYLKEI